MSSYKAWVRDHPTQARYVEEALHHVAWILPSIVGDESGVAAELCYSSSGVLGLLHDHILAGRASPLAARPGRSPREENEIALRWGLTALRSLEVVLELSAGRLGGEEARWKTIVAIETIRASIQTYLLLSTRERYERGAVSRPDAPARRILVDGGTLSLPPPPEGDEDNVEDASEPQEGEEGARWWRGRRSGVRLSVPEDFTREMSKNVDDRVGLSTEGGAVASLRLAGELVYIARPAVYAWARVMFSRRSWTPVAVSAVLDAGSWMCHRLAERGAVGEAMPQGTLLADPTAPEPGAGAVAPPDTSTVAHLVQAELRSFVEALLGSAATMAGPPRSLSPADTTPLKPRASLVVRTLLWLVRSPRSSSLSAVEQSELARRQRLWALYLLRSPLFELVLDRAATGVVDSTRWIPLIGFLLSYARDMLRYYQNIHFYTSGM